MVVKPNLTSDLRVLRVLRLYKSSYVLLPNCYCTESPMLVGSEEM